MMLACQGVGLRGGSLSGRNRTFGENARPMAARIDADVSEESPRFRHVHERDGRVPTYDIDLPILLLKSPCDRVLVAPFRCDIRRSPVKAHSQERRSCAWR